MKLQVLVDNNTIIDSYFMGEPALSYLLKFDGKKILFDLGYSNVFMQNAFKMNENLLDIDYIVFSHGHNDHTGGLKELTKFYNQTSKDFIPPTIIAHPNVFSKKFYGTEEIGSFLSLKDVKKHYNFHSTCKPFWFNDSLVYLGQIPKSNNFENTLPLGQCDINGKIVDDFLEDDTALAYKSENGLVVITGCSHAGICNIIEYAKKVCDETKVADVIGGFHLLNPSKEQSEKTIQYFKSEKIPNLHPCHCTSLVEKIKLSHVTSIKEVGVGQTYIY